MFSGGQDSATALGWALSRFEAVETLGFDYGQRHRVELAARGRILARIPQVRPAWADRLGKDHLRTVSIPPAEVPKEGLPATFIPGRNLLFFLHAAIIAEQRGLRVIVGGMCETDFSGYPDCRDDAIKALQAAVNIGMAARLIFETPLMWIDKRATWHLAAELGGERFVDLILEESHTCYAGNREQRFAWGYGCNDCAACDLRAIGWTKFCRDLAS